MSKKAAADFVAMAANDPKITEKVRSKGKSFSKERYAQAAKVGKESGFEFTADELQSVVSAVQNSQEGELQDEELEAVVGGVAWWQRLVMLLNGGGDSGGSGVAGVRG